MAVSTAPEDIDIDSVDLVDPLLYGTGDPHSIWHALRAREPVRWQQVDDRVGFWSVTTLDGVTTVLRDYTAFTAERGSVLSLLGAGDPAGGRQLAVTDPPRHTAMRSQVQRALNQRSIDGNVELIAAEVRLIVDEIPPGEVVDLAALVGALPMAVGGALLGVDRADWPALMRLTSLAVAPDDPTYQIDGDGPATAQFAHRELFGYFQDVVVSRGRQPGDDLIGRLLTTELEDGRRLRAGEVVSNCYGLVLGANVTMPHVVSSAVVELADGDSWEEWASRPELLDSGVEEALRWASPANHFMRHAVRDIELGGAQVRAGDAVVAWIGSANRDESAFSNPYRFDVGRKPNPHIAFGVGPHYCIGHALARAALRMFFTELHCRFGGFELAGPVEHLHSNFVAGIKHLPVMARASTARLASKGPPVGKATA